MIHTRRPRPGGVSVLMRARSPDFDQQPGGFRRVHRAFDGRPYAGILLCRAIGCFASYVCPSQRALRQGWIFQILREMASIESQIATEDETTHLLGLAAAFKACCNACHNACVDRRIYRRKKCGRIRRLLPLHECVSWQTQ